MTMNRNECWVAFEQTFKIRTGEKSQTVRLQFRNSSAQQNEDEFSFRLPGNPLQVSQKDEFTNLNSFEALRLWLTSFGGKEEAFPLVGSRKASGSVARRKSRQRKELFLPPHPFVQESDGIENYEERFSLFRSLCNATCLRLLSMQSTGVNTLSPATGLLFPQRREGYIRVSEQEARFQFCIAATNASNAAWAVEVPTTRCYKQKKDGNKWMSGRTDVALFEYVERWRRILNIEFKAGRAKVEDFAKDLEQLVREQIPGAWFHLLDDIADLDFAISNMRKGLKVAIRVPLNLPPNFPNEEIYRVDLDIAICVLTGITTGTGVSTGADLYLKRIQYRRPNPEHFDCVIEHEFKNLEYWDRQHFSSATASQ